MHKEIEQIKIHVAELLDDEMRDHAFADPVAHDIPFQIFRVLCGYREALDEIKKLNNEVSQLRTEVATPVLVATNRLAEALSLVKGQRDVLLMVVKEARTVISTQDDIERDIGDNDPDTRKFFQNIIDKIDIAIEHSKEHA